MIAGCPVSMQAQVGVGTPVVRANDREANEFSGCAYFLFCASDGDGVHPVGAGNGDWQRIIGVWMVFEVSLGILFLD